MKIEVSNGEILDKYTILMIKKHRIVDVDKLVNVEREIEELFPCVLTIMNDPQVAILYDELFTVNELLWEIEDKIREHERSQTFDDVFISLARAVYKTNDTRAKIKKNINLRTNSVLIEEKSYEHY
jgi:hypothetical protein